MGLLDGLKAMFAGSQKSAKPSIGAKSTGSSGGASPPDVIAREILAQMKIIYTLPIGPDRTGLHIETLLSALGAMAGFGSQVAVRLAVQQGLIPAAGALVEARTEDGGAYYFGDQINQPLLEAPMSVWAHIAGAVEKTGKPLPDMLGIVRHVAASVGHAEFGRLRVPNEFQPVELPIEALKHHWRGQYAFIRARSNEPLWTGWYFALAAQFLILEAKDVIDPTMAGTIVMESAIAMAKIDPKLIGFEI